MADEQLPFLVSPVPFATAYDVSWCIDHSEGDGITCDDELDIPDDQWGWESILGRGGLNLWTALQKVGKTNLVLQMLSLWSAGADSFLEQAFCGPCPPVIIVGVDMGIRSRQSKQIMGFVET